MLQRDYLMRMTEMLTAVIAKVMFNKEIKNYEEAEKEIETAAKTIVGLDLRIINILNPQDIIQLMKTSDLYAGRCLVSAELLKEYADVHELNGKDNSSIILKSLNLYIEAILSKELPEPEKYYSKINELISFIAESDLQDDLNFKIIDYYEFSGQYSKAEDMIFELIENNNKDIIDRSVSFYKKLLHRTDEELESGNLSREEVNDALDEILKIKD
ncbi:MAG: DUF6483 family protein [Ignavibacteria bacterium]|nr:hypothetical protein [Ignavibacteria bacterium]MBK8383171.1 hypothetical protein [Ignavibacteria bacterium]MBK9403019.1 hypothetical protein [Ignavibacteria bacterium]MBL0107666.1 hypothetical protein [Ignavibacteria bacterium]